MVEKIIKIVYKEKLFIVFKFSSVIVKVHPYVTTGTLILQ